jgi:hypothetical protein
MRRYSCIVIVAALMPAVGCQSDAHKARPMVVQNADAPPPAAPSPVAGGTGNSATPINDPSASRMQDLCGALLYYYAANRHLPLQLEELRPYADIGVTLGMTSPVSGEAYVYVPKGMRGNAIRDTLILYDPHESAKGERWGIVMVPPEAGKAVLMYAIPLNEALLRAYGG